MSIIWTGLAPHPPIIVETVGGERCAQVRPTIESMRRLALDLMDHEPERLVVISPHTPRPRKGIATWSAPRISGDFRQFGALNPKLDLPVDQAWLRRFRDRYADTVELGFEPLDHGAMVPLAFLAEAGWREPTCVLGLPWDEDAELDRIAAALSSASEDPLRTAVLASGDMSHCLLPSAPCGYHESGPQFDRAFVSMLKRADFKGAAAVDPHLREGARQDVVESCRVVWEASDYRSENHCFFGYEGPFGVGYTVMKFFGAPP